MDESIEIGGEVSSVDYWQASYAHQPAGLYCSCKPVFCSHVTLTGYPLPSLVSPSLLLPCVTVCHHISTGLYQLTDTARQSSDLNL